MVFHMEKKSIFQVDMKYIQKYSVSPVNFYFSKLRSKTYLSLQLSHKNNHRIIECFGLARIFRGHPAQPPCSEQGHLQLDQVAQSPV